MHPSALARERERREKGKGGVRHLPQELQSNAPTPTLGIGRKTPSAIAGSEGRKERKGKEGKDGRKEGREGRKEGRGGRKEGKNRREGKVVMMVTPVGVIVMVVVVMVMTVGGRW